MCGEKYTFTHYLFIFPHCGLEKFDCVLSSLQVVSERRDVQMAFFYSWALCSFLKKNLTQMPSRGLRLRLLCRGGYWGLRFSDVALGLTFVMTFRCKHLSRRNMGLFSLVTPAPTITALGTKWTLRELTESTWVVCHHPTLLFVTDKDKNTSLG